MKFSHSQRTLQNPNNHTPPCNYYRLPQNNNKIKTGSLLGPTLHKQLPNFGLSARFADKNQKKAPGPGAYFNNKQPQQIKGFIKTGVVVRQYKKHGFLGGQQRNPSIPYTQFRLDEQDQEYIRQLQINEDLNRSAISLKRKTDGYTFAKSPRSFNKTESPKKQQRTPLEAIAQYNERLKKQERKPKINTRVQLQKNNQRRTQIINMMNPEFVPSLQFIEMVTKRRTKFVPGPGFYHNEKQQEKTVEPGVCFTTSKRFSQDKISNLGPGKYKIQDEKKKSMSFSKSNRNLFNLKNQTDLEHHFYLDPFSDIKKRQNLNSKGQEQPFSFGSQVARFTKLQKQPKREAQLDKKSKKQTKIEAVVEMRLQKLKLSEKRSTKQSQGLLGISTMASTIQ